MGYLTSHHTFSRTQQTAASSVTTSVSPPERSIAGLCAALHFSETGEQSPERAMESQDERTASREKLVAGGNGKG